MIILKLSSAANQRIPRAWDVDVSQPPPPLFAEPVRAEGFGEGASRAPTKGEVYRAAMGLTGKNPVQALGELCTRLKLPPPYYTVAVRVVSCSFLLLRTSQILRIVSSFSHICTLYRDGL